jgi:hypothetical protein
LTKGSSLRFWGLFSRKGRVSSRQAVRRVQQAYAEAEHGGLQAAYADVRWRTRVLRSCLALADRLYPVTEAIHFAGEMDERIRKDGLPEACRGGAERLRLDCEYVMSDATREILTSSRVIIYGNHPTLLTPFLVGAAARRADLRYFMMSYVGQLIPSLRQYMLPLELSSPSGWREWRRGGNRRMVAHWLTQVLEKGRKPVDPKPANRQSLGRGAQHVHDGGCVVIFPSGGGRKDRAWYPGIGQLAQQLARDPAAPDVYLVPMREEGSSNDHVYRSLRGLGDGAPAAGPRLSPIRVRFAEPRRLKDFVSPDASRGEITRRLQADYEEGFPPSRPHWVMRVLFPWRLAWGRGRA